MSKSRCAAAALAVVVATVASGELRSEAATREALTAGEFLAACDELDPGCRNEFVAGLQAVTEGKMACPPRIDVNTPISPWLAYMHRRVSEKPALSDVNKNELQLEAFLALWPCPKK